MVLMKAIKNKLKYGCYKGGSSFCNAYSIQITGFRIGKFLITSSTLGA